MPAALKPYIPQEIIDIGQRLMRRNVDEKPVILVVRAFDFEQEAFLPAILPGVHFLYVIFHSGFAEPGTADVTVAD
jgi:hypothetical protein